MSQAELLFSRYDLSAVLQNHEQKTIQAIDAFDANRMLNTSIEDLVGYFFEENKVDSSEITRFFEITFNFVPLLQ